MFVQNFIMYAFIVVFYSRIQIHTNVLISLMCQYLKLFFNFHCVILWQADNEPSSTRISPCMSTRGRGAPHTPLPNFPHMALVTWHFWPWNRHLPKVPCAWSPNLPEIIPARIWTQSLMSLKQCLRPLGHAATDQTQDWGNGALDYTFPAKKWSYCWVDRFQGLAKFNFFFQFLQELTN